MSRRNKILIVVAVIFLALLLLLLWLSMQQQPAAPIPVVNETPSISKPLGGSLNASVSGSTNAAVNKPATGTTPAAPQPKPDEQAELRRLAMAFAERFGSFSNSSDFENITDLEVFMSDAMVAWAEKFVADARAGRVVSPVYFGTTTRSISAEVVAFNSSAGTAEIKVTTQRQELTGTSSGGNVYYQVLDLKFLKKAAVWKVDSANWLPKS